MSNDITPSHMLPAVPSVPERKPAQSVRAQVAEVTPPKPKFDPQEAQRELQATTEHLNKQMAQNSRDLSFRVDDVAKMVVVTMKNRDGDVIRQIPNEVVLRLAHNIENMKGLMQDEKS